MSYFKRRRAEILGPRKRRPKVTLAQREQFERYSKASSGKATAWAARRLELHLTNRSEQ